MRPVSVLRILLFCCIAAPLAAQQNTALFPKFGISAGGYLGDFATKLEVDPHVEGVQGTTIDLEKNLGLDSHHTLSRFELQWRPFRRHEIEASYVRTQRTGLRTIDRSIVFEDTTFPVQAAVHSTFDIDFLEVKYAYWLRQTERGGLAANIGVTRLNVNGTLLVRNNTNDTVVLDEGAGAKFPVPAFGAEGRYQITSRLIGIARGSVLPNVTFRRYKGEAWIGKADVEYRAVRNVGLGVGWNYFHLTGGVAGADVRADLGMTVSGFEAYAHLVFGSH